MEIIKFYSLFWSMLVVKFKIAEEDDEEVEEDWGSKMYRKMIPPSSLELSSEFFNLTLFVYGMSPL
jgi:predicted metal-binding protein